MPAMRPEDLPAGHFLRFAPCKFEKGDCFEIISVNEHGDYLYELGWIRMNTNSNPWAVDQVEAPHGWGPLLYDAAIEFATNRSSGLRPDPKIVSPEASEIWKKYYFDRPDVEHEPLQYDSSLIHNCETNPELCCVYKKLPGVVTRLEELGKIFHLGH